MVKEVLMITFYVVASAAVVAVFVATCSLIGAYIVPRIKIIAKGEQTRRHVADCCPPGVGCNDPHPGSQQCLRVETRRIAKVEELIVLEQTWSAFCGVPKRRKREREAARGAYAEARDGIIARALRDAGEQFDSHRQLQLPSHLSPGIQGEVLDKPNHTRGSSYVSAG